MASHVIDQNFFLGEILFYTIDFVTGELTYWLFDDCSGKYFNSATAEFFVCETNTYSDNSIIYGQQRLEERS
ncbi:Uncharacterized protein APZ42_032242 [Daphnia magna]|uniref:Uncharacterized protein n=1 Tax=Daphnia magna TaxID=35525 RepID=A0A162D9T4_9CRUS|nr:Uncharacterized protein APZ42_032242 [Daphnia magna]